MSVIDHERSESLAILSNSELAMAFIRFCTQGLDIKTFDDFKTWINVDLKRFFPHDAFLAFFSTFDSDDGEFKVSHLTSIDFPLDYAKGIRSNKGQERINSPIISQTRQKRMPQLFNLSQAKEFPEVWVENFKLFDLENIAAHGVTDIDGRRTSCFTFHRIPGMVDQSHADMLKLLTPHLHAVYTRVVALAQSGSQPNSLLNVSVDEMEILHWLVRGKSNWEISAITGRSQAMVKRHVSNLLAKLDVGSRVQAAAKAVELGLVDAPLQRAAGAPSSISASRTYPNEGRVLLSPQATRPGS